MKRRRRAVARNRSLGSVHTRRHRHRGATGTLWVRTRPYATLGDERFTASWTEGSPMAIEDAVNYALQGYGASDAVSVATHHR